MPLNQNYNPKEFEKDIYTQWMTAKVGEVDNKNTPVKGSNEVRGSSDGHSSTDNKGISRNNTTPTLRSTPSNGVFSNVKTHSILMPPPNLTGNLHAGHSFQHYLMDTLSRLARQRGEQNLWFPGVDHAGLQLEGVIDKLIKKGEFDGVLENYAKNTLVKGSNEVRGSSDGVLAVNNEGILKQVQDDGEQNTPVKGSSVAWGLYNNDLFQLPKDELPKYLKQNYPDLWLECAWSKVNEWRDNQKNQASVLGDTPDYSRSLFTLDEQNIEMVNYAFLKYWQDGLIYKGSYLVNWSVGLQTALSDVAGEIEYEKKIDPFVTFEYRLFTLLPHLARARRIDPSIQINLHPGTLVNLDKSILVGTVRPETIFGDYAVAVHPDIFERDYSEFKDLIQKKTLYVQLPLTNRFVPVILADEVDPNFGSGALKITPANDQVDYDIFNKYIGGEFEGAIGRDGKLTELCGKYSGLTVQDGRRATIKDLVEHGFVPKKESLDDNGGILKRVQDDGGTEKLDPKKYFGIEFADGINPDDYQINWNYEHNVTVCERTKTVVEPLISEEFFISYHNEFDWTPINKDDNVSIANRGKKTNLQKLGIEAVNKTNFYCEDYKERGINFLENIKDWCISRDLIWGHKMPVWYNLDTNPERKFYSYSEIVLEAKGQISNSPREGWQTQSDGVFSGNQYFQISPTKPTTRGNWVQEEKILDTWFSSCLWPLSTLKYPEFVGSKIPLLKGSEQSSGGCIKANVIFIGGGEVFETKEQYQSWLKSPESNFTQFKTNANYSGKDWKSTLKSIFDSENVQFIEPIMPNKSNAQYEDWKIIFEKILPFINPNSILIGYSLGSIFLTKYLAENKVAYDSLLLLAGGVEINNNSFKTSENLEFINSEYTCIIHSHDDEIVPIEKSKTLLSLIPIAKHEFMDGCNHFFGESNMLVEYISFYFGIGKYKKSEGGFNYAKGDFETFYPTQELTTGKDIFYQWIVRMTMLSYYFTAEIPYTDLVITPTILDDKGKKMSKSLGNGMDPVAQIDKYSSDSMRMAMLGGMIPDRNIKMGGRLADELCEKYRNFGNKMWNIARFFEYQDEKVKEVE